MFVSAFMVSEMLINRLSEHLSSDREAWIELEF